MVGRSSTNAPRSFFEDSDYDKEKEGFVLSLNRNLYLPPVVHRTVLWISPLVRRVRMVWPGWTWVVSVMALPSGPIVTL